MADTSEKQLFDIWKKQLEEGTQAWTRLVSQAPPTAPPDPSAFWRPVLDEGLHAWAKLFAQSPLSLDLVVGDFTAVHSDHVYAAGTPFKEPIAPGIYTAGLVSAVIGTRLPGPGAVYVSQSLKFMKPVKAGDTITARVEVLEVIRERNRIRMQTTCTNQRNEEVLSGEAWVMLSMVPIV